MPKSLACSAPQCSRASARTCSKTRSSSISTVSTIAVRRSRWCTGPVPRGVFIGAGVFGPKTPCVVVVGSQWGDEGKGKIVALLAGRADLVVRYQGGANDGHTVDTGAGEFVLHQIPSGIIQGAVCVVGNGVVLDPETFFTELDALTSRGIRTDHKLYVSDRAHLTLPYHKLLDRAREQRDKIGGAGIGPAAIDAVLGVVRAYTTRVGNGPLPTEAEAKLAERIRELGGEFGATTGRPRRCGWFDAVVVRYAVRVNGLTGLAVTKLDVLDSFPEIPVGVGYRLDGEIVDSMPADVERIERVEPIYETLPGWQKPLRHLRRLAALPPPARAYLDRLQDLAHAPIRYVSVGTQRDQIIEVA